MSKLALFLGVILFAVSGMAQEDSETGGMPPMGPPAQLEELAYLVGVWDVDMEWRMDDTSSWTSSTTTTEYRMALGGAALIHEHTSSMMGMPFVGMGIMTFDRETNLWQSTWTDNLSARTSLYAGERGEGRLVLMGEDLWQGQKYLTRITTFDEKPGSFQWTMEHSYDGGQTWYMSGRATYTRQK